jgi:aminomethyltransferase
MPLESPFHARIAPLCTSYAWKQWGGYYAVAHFGESHLPEYWAFRESCAVTDVTPLFKYELAGRDAAKLLSRMLVRSVRPALGRVATRAGARKVIDDGTVSRLGESASS